MTGRVFSALGSAPRERRHGDTGLLQHIPESLKPGAHIVGFLHAKRFIDHQGHRVATDRPTSGLVGRQGALHPARSNFVKGIDMTDDEKQALLAFLRSLTDRSFVENPQLSDPWPAR